jgi:hypothetical protein
MVEYISHCVMKIETSEGLYEEADAKNISISTTQTQNPVNTINRHQVARGFQRGTKEVTASFTLAARVAPDLDYEQLFEDNETLQIFTSDEPNGKNRHIVNCKIESIETSYDPDGNVEHSLEIKAIDNKRS